MSFAAVTAALALATPFGEPPSRPVSGAAKCLQATGAPGELIRQTGKSAQLLRVGPGGLVPGAVLPLRSSADACAAVAAAPGGAGVIAFSESSSTTRETAVTAYLRDPGQGWGASAAILPLAAFNEVDLATAVSERGDALVAAGVWSIENPISVLAMRRAPGGGFGAPVTVATLPPETPGVPELRAGMSATGEAFVAYSAAPGNAGDPRALWVAEAAPGAAFGAPRRIGTVGADASFELAVGPDGRALLVFVSGRRVIVAERAPGGTWGVPVPLTDATGGFSAQPTVALRPDGAAVVVWMDAAQAQRARPSPRWSRSVRRSGGARTRPGRNRASAPVPEPDRGLVQRWQRLRERAILGWTRAQASRRRCSRPTAESS